MVTPPQGFPQSFGKYRLLRKLARGGMAELFLAEDSFGHLVVIKRVLPHLTQETDFLKMFLNEARVAALLNHPKIVRVFDLGMEGEHLFLAMDFVDGYDLETLARCAGGRLPPAIAAKVASDVCDALYYANRVNDLEGKPLNVVHRDVTPGNVMITRQGEVKLVDFGVAKAAAQLERTRPGVVKGKFRYMSPEQIEFKELDGRSDLFSLGVLLYEICTGDRPFERKQLLDIINALTGWTPPPPTEVVKGFPKPLSLVIMKALEKDREKRYRTAREMQTALELAQKNPLGKAELAAFVGELIRAHPKELPVAPEFEPEAGSTRQPATDPARPSVRPSVDPPAPPRPRASERLPRREVSEDEADSGEQRTEALSGNLVKQMIAEADRRASAKAAGLTPPPLGRQSSRLPPMAPPLPAQAAGEARDEGTTTDPHSRLRAGAGRRSGSHPASNPVIPAAAEPGSSPKESDPRSAPEPNPDTLRVRRPIRRTSAPFPAPPVAAESPPAADGDEDLDSLTGSFGSSPPGESSGVSAITKASSSVTEAPQASGRRIILFTILAVLCVAALAAGWFLFGVRPTDAREDPSPPLEASPIDEPDAEQPDPAAGEEGSKRDAGRETDEHPPAAPTDDPETDASPEGDEPDSSPAEPGAPASASDASSGGLTGELAVEGTPGIRVSIDGMPARNVPFTLTLAPGKHRCTYLQRGGRTKRCSQQPRIEAGKTVSIRVM
ncbi:MAG: protein kinase [Deltaproteobacteria bacterium]|nr:protein kinase [Deltaproteobacteria bacterium]